MLYAWREWLSYPAAPKTPPSPEEDPASESSCDQKERGPTPVTRREVLTARRGQRPSAWLDFEECRRIMLNWPGYRILWLEAA